MKIKEKDKELILTYRINNLNTAVKGLHKVINILVDVIFELKDSNEEILESINVSSKYIKDINRNKSRKI